MNVERPEVQTKIVATVGPACAGQEQLRALIEAGVDVFRLNLTHGAPEEHAAVARRIRLLERELRRAVGILADLPGPKIRLGDLLQSPMYCQVGDEFVLVEHRRPQHEHEVTVSWPGLTELLQEGDRVLLADGTVGWRVTARVAGGVRCVVEKPGEIRSRSGVHVPGVSRGLKALTRKDLTLLDELRAIDVDFVGLSYAATAEDVRELRDALATRGIPARIVTKIERKAAVDNLEQLLESSDALMIARGDLGVEVDIARMAVLQKEILRAARRYRLPVITATQMLESMRTSPLPTRAEATDVANAVLDGSDALMLSGETAVGKHPVLVVQTMRRIIAEAEQMLVRDSLLRSAIRPRHAGRAIESLATAAASMGENLEATYLVVTTKTGHSAFVLAKERCFRPTLALTDDERTWRALTLCWGARPVLVPEFRASYDTIRYVTDYAEQYAHRLQPGQKLVILGSTHWTSTRHDMVVVHEVA